MNLFIDTNKYLNLYALPLKELKDLERLIELIQEGKITLWLPEQVENEFYRNREERLFDFHKEIDKLIPEYDKKELPKIPEGEKYLRMVDEALNTIVDGKNKIKSISEEMKKEFEGKIKNYSFFADDIVKRLFSSAIMIHNEKEILSKAITRNNLGNPPGRSGSYGDSVIWESLLEKIPEGEDLYFVGSDKHFKSKLDNDFSPYLKKEWEENKKSKIIRYEHLGEFTKDQIPEIKTSDNIIEEETKIDKEYKFVPELLAWIDSKGGLSGLNIGDVAEIIDSYLFDKPPEGFSFVPTLQVVHSVIESYRRRLRNRRLR